MFNGAIKFNIFMTNVENVIYRNCDKIKKQFLKDSLKMFPTFQLTISIMSNIKAIWEILGNINFNLNYRFYYFIPN